LKRYHHHLASASSYSLGSLQQASIAFFSSWYSLLQTPLWIIKPRALELFLAFYMRSTSGIRRISDGLHTNPHAFYNTTLVAVLLLLAGSIATRCCEELMLAFATFFPCLLFVSVYLILTRRDRLQEGQEGRKEKGRKEIGKGKGREG
jgi:hypothetical protein